MKNTTCQFCGKPLTEKQQKQGNKYCSHSCYLRAPKKLRYTLDHVRADFEKSGCVLLSTEYLGCWGKLDYICSCGNPSKISYAGFKRGGRCQACGILRSGQQKRIAYRQVEQAFIAAGFTLLSSSCDYINNRSRLKFICSCGRISEISYLKITEGQACKYCAPERQAAKRRLTYEYVSKFFRDAGCELLSSTYKGSFQKLRYRCRCGREAITTYADFYSGKRCKKCYLERNSGSGNYKWNSQLTTEERITRRAHHEYAQWRTDVFTRDDFVCQTCGQRGGKLRAHHLESYSSNRSLGTEVSNGVTLCEDCHRDFHKTYGWGDNTKEQFNQFTMSKGVAWISGGKQLAKAF